MAQSEHLLYWKGNENITIETLGEEDPGLLMMFFWASRGDTKERRLDVSEVADIGARLSSTRQTLEPKWAKMIGFRSIRGPDSMPDTLTGEFQRGLPLHVGPNDGRVLRSLQILALLGGRHFRLDSRHGWTHRRRYRGCYDVKRHLPVPNGGTNFQKFMVSTIGTTKVPLDQVARRIFKYLKKFRWWAVVGRILDGVTWWRHQRLFDHLSIT